ncbi:MAG: acyl-CoA dehydratase activase [Sedimentisphaerales bacterium]
MKYHLGIDAGSSYIKLALIDAAGNMAAKGIVKRGADIDASCRQGYADLLGESKITKEQIAGVIATGYGRKQVGFCDEGITEITALAIGGFAVDNGVRTIIDVGGQDSKVIAIDESGRVVDFVMNQKCSAGTGKFLEVTSASLGVKVDELDQLSQKADKVLNLSSTCTVFAETEIISYIAMGEKKENIIKSLHQAISDHVVGLFRQVTAGDDGKILFVGGVSLNNAMTRELSSQLNRQLLVPQNPQYIGAYGAALYLKRKEGRSDSK